MGNNYQIEGIDDNERTGLLQILVPPIEAIQTVDVATSNFDAELGRASGAVVNVAMSSRRLSLRVWRSSREAPGMLQQRGAVRRLSASCEAMSARPRTGTWRRMVASSDPSPSNASAGSSTAGRLLGQHLEVDLAEGDARAGGGERVGDRVPSR